MTTPKQKRKRKTNQLAKIPLLPILLIMFIIGWSLYCTGDRKKKEKIQPKPALKDNVKFLPVSFRAELQTANKINVL